VRSLSVILILSISIGMALVMFMSMRAVQNRIDSVKSSIGNTVSVSPAGVRGFEGGGELLTSENADMIKNIPNVTKVVEIVSERLTNGTDTNLVSAVEAGSFGNRQRERQSVGNDTNQRSPQGNFTPPIMVTGTNDFTSLSNLNASKFEITSGEKFDVNTQDLVSLIGKSLAEKNNLSTGSVFQAYGKDIKVVGIFDGGNTFSNANLIMPVKTLQTLSGQSGQYNSLTVQVNSIDSLPRVVDQIKDKLGSKVDVVSSQDSSSEAITPLQNIKNISLYSLIGSIIAGTIILFLTMVMIVRERRREIGVLKAIGSSNVGITFQFAIESLVLTSLSSVIGIIVGTFLSNPILKVLVSNNSTNSQITNQGPEGAGRMMRLGVGVAGGAQSAISNLSANVGWEIILYGILAAMIIAVIGSMIPSFAISKISPAEVMRAE
jgi:putative ABC transport system permease protein